MLKCNDDSHIRKHFFGAGEEKKKKGCQAPLSYLEASSVMLLLGERTGTICPLEMVYLESGNVTGMLGPLILTSTSD